MAGSFLEGSLGKLWRALQLALYVTILTLSYPQVAEGALHTRSLATLTDTKEYCSNEEFKPRCGSHEVVMMTHASYGRMQLGRCMKKRLGFTSCHSSVLTLLDRRCSGKPTCEIRVPDSDLDATKPCDEELKSYLEVRYECVEVAHPTHMCQPNKQWAMTESQGYVSKSVVTDTKCGTMSSPLLITALPGQRVNITLFDFNPITSSTSGFDYISDDDCEQYGHVIDRVGERTVAICRGGVRVQHVYLSANRSLELVLDTKRRDHVSFLIHYQAVGCPDIAPPEGMSFSRHGNEAQVGCLVTMEVWTLVCVDGEWMGEIGNCSKFIVTPRDTPKQHKGLSHGISVIIIVTIAIGIGVVVLLCGIFVIKRMRKKSETHNSAAPGRHTDEAEELEQLKVNYDNEVRGKYHPNEPELLQHVIYEKGHKEHIATYSPLPMCMHESAHVQLRGPEVLWKASTLPPLNQCDYEAHKTPQSACASQATLKDNVAFVQPCTLSTFVDNTTKPETEPPPGEGNTPEMDNRKLYGKNARMCHETIYTDRPTCVHTHGRVNRNPRNIYEPKRNTRVLFNSVNNSF